MTTTHIAFNDWLLLQLEWFIPLIWIGLSLIAIYYLWRKQNR